MRGDTSALWRVIYIAHGEKQAQQIEALLSEQGFLIDRKRLQDDTSDSLDDIEIRALDAEAQEARLCLMEQGY